MTNTLLNPTTDQRYRDFIATHPQATIFHTPEWISVLCETYRFSPLCAAVIKNDVIVAALPLCETRSITGKKRLVSLPFSDFCEPLVDTPEAMEKLIEFTCESSFGKKAKYIELRGGKSLLPSAKTGKTILTHTIDCSISKDLLFKNLRLAVQRNIRKAERSELTVSIERSECALSNFYEMNCQTRKEHGLPPQPYIFFENIRKNLFENGLGWIASVMYNGRVVSAGLFLHFKNRVWYKFGASVRSFQHLRPNDFMLWKGICHSKDIGCAAVNLGRTETDHAGLIQFKRGWNGVEQEINYYHYCLQLKAFQEIEGSICDRLYPALFSRTPVLFLKPIGSFIHQFAG